MVSQASNVKKSKVKKKDFFKVFLARNFLGIQSFQAKKKEKVFHYFLSLQAYYGQGQPLRPHGQSGTLAKAVRGNTSGMPTSDAPKVLSFAHFFKNLKFTMPKKFSDNNILFK